MFSKKLLESEVSRHIRLGSKVSEKLPEILIHLRVGRNILILYQENNLFIDTLDQLIEKIANNNKNIRKIVLKAISEKIPFYCNEITIFSPHIIVLIGDIKTIDFGKYIIYSFYEQFHKKLEWISIPTTPESDSIASPFIFLDIDGKGEKYIGQVNTPMAILADTDILKCSSNNCLSSGIGDLFSRQTAIWDWKLANRLRGETISDFVVAVSSETIDILAKQLQGINPEHDEATFIVVKALIIAGFLGGFAADIRSCYGSEHMFAEALDAEEPGKASHGQRVALGTIMMASLQGQDWKNIRKSLKKFNLSISSTPLGYKTTSIVKALINANLYPKTDKMYTIIEPGIVEEAAWSLAYRTGIIGSRF
ncbi:MAG: iron-containing alcohol dehydrogenase [Candidatus Thorarchaeota archaeon]